jgi:hypothetical protein
VNVVAWVPVSLSLSVLSSAALVHLAEVFVRGLCVIATVSVCVCVQLRVTRVEVDA